VNAAIVVAPGSTLEMTDNCLISNNFTGPGSVILVGGSGKDVDVASLAKSFRNNYYGVDNSNATTTNTTNTTTTNATAPPDDNVICQFVAVVENSGRDQDGDGDADASATCIDFDAKICKARLSSSS